MQTLWTPWRMRYVGGERAPGCVFCNAIANPEDRQSLVIHVGEHAFLILNRFPYNSGHLMIVPIEHVPSIEDLDPATRAEMMELANLAIEVCRPVFRCDGFNLGMNIGQVAGAGIADHLHMHLVPRWTGDANFMPILSDTMVLPETLDATYARLRAELTTHIARNQGDLELAAGALVYLPDDDAFVLRAVPGRPAVIPKGKIERGETAAEAAVREVIEETGIEPRLVGWLGAQLIEPVPGFSASRQCVSYFLATGTRSERYTRDDVLLVPAGEIDGAIEIPELRDVVSAARVQLDELTGRRR